ncbi:lactonase family protein [Nibricoccus sp. IMCC34717]|uniref:lactonase family protein n=1 Tax=Nibricoccus sp. IMCC34717 TaxID=3034021 RepID=UPI00384E6511
MHKAPFVLAAALAATMPTFAKTSVVYLGCFGSGFDKPGIFVTEFDSTTGNLAEPKPAATGTEMSWLVWSPQHRRVYASGMHSWDPRRGYLASFEPQADNRLQLVREQPNGGDATVHLSLVPGGRGLIGVNYSQGNALGWPLDASGDPLPAVSDIPHALSHPPGWVANDRQEAPHPHGIHLAPDGRFAFVPDLGTDRLVAYAVTANGALTPKPELDVVVPAGQGPRHMTFSADGRFAYEISELVARVRAYAYDAATGKLALVQDLPALPEDFKGGHSGAEVVIHPNGRFLYASNRQEYQSIAVFARDESTGQLTPVQQWRPGLTHPRHFTFSPDARWLLVTNTFADTVVTAPVDPQTGKIGALTGRASVPRPTCILFVE